MNRLATYIIICILLIIGTTSAYSQGHQEEGIFAFAYNPTGSNASSKAIPDYKITTAHRVFDKLVEAKGVRNMPKPTLIIENAERRPAWTKPKEALVVLEEKAYDICIEMGKDSLNALAALLGHELIHYYEKHDWKDLFIAKNEFLNIASNTDEDPSLEFQADHLGGLLAHIAGYKTLGILPSLLSKIYESYGLSTTTSIGYPSLEERRAVAQKSDVLLTESSRIFDMSVYLTATGEYELANEYLNFLIMDTKFQSREIYNNLGALQLLMSLDLLSATEIPYFFPIEIELNSRISTRAGTTSTLDDLLSAAEYNLKNAIVLDATYPQAHLNLAIFYIIQEQWLDATYHTQKAEAIYAAIPEAEGLSKCSNVHGIIAASKGEEARARSLFIHSNSDLGNRNLCILNKGNNCNPVKLGSNKYYPLIDGVDLNQLFSRIMQNKEQAVITIDLDLNNSFYTVAKDNTEILVHLDHQKMGEYVFIQVATDPDLKYSNDIGIGSPIDKVFEFMGQPKAIINASHRRIFIYKEQRILFIVDQNDLILEWCLFKSTTS